MYKTTIILTEKNKKIISNLSKITGKNQSEIMNDMINDFNLLNMKLDLILENQEEILRRINEESNY